MLVRPIEFGSVDYESAKELRRRFLREPLGLDLSPADLAGEELQHHFGLFDSATTPAAADLLLGAVTGKPDPDDALTVRIRQMVIDAERRGAGLGRRLLVGAERLLAARGFERSILYARDEAVPFYERCGYLDTGENAMLIGLPHHRMRKPLDGADQSAQSPNE